MAGGTERHDLAVGRIFRTLAEGAESRGGRAITAHRLVRTSPDSGMAGSVGDSERLRWSAYGAGAGVITPSGVLEVELLFEAVDGLATT